AQARAGATQEFGGSRLEGVLLRLPTRVVRGDGEHPIRLIAEPDSGQRAAAADVVLEEVAKRRALLIGDRRPARGDGRKALEEGAPARRPKRRVRRPRLALLALGGPVEVAERHGVDP